MTTVVQAITEVANKVGAVEKGKATSSGPKYSYRGIEDVMNALAPAMHEVGLVLVPHVVEHHFEPMPGRSDWTMTRMVVDYDVYGPEGDRLERPVRALGYGADNGDKGPGKALSYAFKSAVGQLFCLPTDAALDNEAVEIPPPEPAISKEQVAQISALFDQITDGDERTRVKVDWAQGLPVRLHQTPVSAFDAVYASAMDAVEALPAAMA